MSIKLDHVSYIYEPDTAFPVRATDDVSLEIGEGEFIGLIGHTGSGKSTLIQLLNGLVAPTSGTIYYNDKDISGKDFSKKELRSRVGLVFQYPEHQLFEMDVLTDVCFGPKNQGLPEEEVRKRAKQALDMVGLDESYYKQSPFELSGGQKRRVAIAGVLAMEPDVLILDEPTAGLDPKGRDEILDQVAHLHKTKNISIVLVSHSMEDVAKYAERLIVMDHGKMMFDASPTEVFRHHKELERMGLAAPQVTYIAHMLKERGFDINMDITTVQQAKQEILKIWRKNK